MPSRDQIITTMHSRLAFHNLRGKPRTKAAIEFLAGAVSSFEPDTPDYNRLSTDLFLLCVQNRMPEVHVQLPS